MDEIISDCRICKFLKMKKHRKNKVNYGECLKTNLIIFSTQEDCIYYKGKRNATL